MKNNIQLSILTPVLNGEKYLQKMIDSVLSQDVPHSEIVFVDGGSTDSTIDIIRRAQKTHPNRILLEILLNDPGQKGCGKAWNRASQLARGRILGWLGADDMSAPGALQYVCSYFERYQETSVIYGNCEIINENDIPLQINKSCEVSYQLLSTGHNPISCPTCFMSKEAFVAVNGVDSYGNDYELFLKLLKLYNIKPIDKTLGRFRIHEASETGNLKKYIATLKLDADALHKHSGVYFSTFRIRWLLSTILINLGLTIVLKKYKDSCRGKKNAQKP